MYYYILSMKFLILKSKNPYLNLAIEEYMFSETSDDVFMLWQNEPSVIIGKNQNAYAEVNMDYVKENKIHIVRRITGGGAVYHDLGNVNYSFISTREKISGIDFKYFTEPIIEALENMGIAAKLSGRNDLLFEDKKFSGNAQHAIGGRVLHHGTILFDSNLEVLSSALYVDEEKLRARSIKSARSRVVNLKGLIAEKLCVGEFINRIAEYVEKKFNPEIISAPENPEVEKLRIRNESFEWIFPDRAYLSEYKITKKKKYEFGLVEINLLMTNEVISEIKIFGDFFGTKDVAYIENELRGKSIFNIKDSLEKITVNDYIYGMTAELLEEHIRG